LDYDMLFALDVATDTEQCRPVLSGAERWHAGGLTASQEGPVLAAETVRFTRLSSIVRFDPGDRPCPAETLRRTGGGHYLDAGASEAMVDGRTSILQARPDHEVQFPRAPGSTMAPSSR
jgi:hypothetical protein